MSSNLQYEGIQEILKKLNNINREKGPTVKEVNQDWRKLASFMSGQK